MTTLISIPTDAPFTLDQRAWLGGFLAGMAAARRHDDETATVPTLTGYENHRGTARLGRFRRHSGSGTHRSCRCHSGG